MTTIWANLDAEATWSGVALPLAVRERLAVISPLLAALAAEEPESIELWSILPIDPARLLGPLAALAPRLRVGTPATFDLAWAQPDAKAVNDRRFAIPLRDGFAHVVTTIAELDARVATLDQWVAKAPLTAAGRDRYRGAGPLVDPEGRTRCARLLEKFGALVVEPWLDRIADVGVCATVHPDGRITSEAPHALIVDARGNFVGIDRTAPPIADRELLEASADRAGVALRDAGYIGCFAIDAFVHRGGLHALCEINARYTFGWIARALGAQRLGFGAAPTGATELVAGAAWMERRSRPES